MIPLFEPTLDIRGEYEFVFHQTYRYGLVGPNGHGKTTLLRHIGTRSLQIPPNIDVLYCEQEVIATDDSALETVLMADVKRTELLKEETDLLKAQNKGQDVTERLNEVFLACSITKF